MLLPLWRHSRRTAQPSLAFFPEVLDAPKRPRHRRHRSVAGFEGPGRLGDLDQRLGPILSGLARSMSPRFSFSSPYGPR